MRRTRTLLQLADRLSLPVDAVTEKLAFLGRTGSGKSYAATKLAELMLEAGAQVVALDVVGIWYGLRTGDHGLKIPVFGGMHGDIPLEPTSGALVADLIVDRNISAVLDISQMLDSEKARFAQAFADRFYFRKKFDPGAVHLFLEECQELVPQNAMKGEERMLHAFERLVKLGRNFGIGVSLISQRPQEVNKKALNQVECVFAFQMTGTHERKAVEAWIADKGIDIDVKALLPKLQVGCPHVWSPRWLGVSEQVRILQKRTLDTSSTPKVGAKRGKTQTLTPIDLAELRTQMAATIDRAKAEDPKELNRRIAELQKQLQARPAAAPAPEPIVKRVEIPMVDLGLINGLRDSVMKKVRAFGRNTERARKVIAEALAEVDRLAEALTQTNQQIEVEFNAGCDSAMRRLDGYNKDPLKAITRGQPPKSGAPAPRQQAIDAGQQILGNGGERTIMIFVAQVNGATREQITVTTGYKRSTRNEYIRRLSQAGFVTLAGDDVNPTPSGIEALGADYKPLPTGQKLRDHWIATLPEGESAILELCFECYPLVISRDDITDRTRYQRSTRNEYIRRLAARKLVVTSHDGEVKASEHLFN